MIFFVGFLTSKLIVINAKINRLFQDSKPTSLEFKHSQEHLQKTLHDFKYKVFAL